MMIENIKISGVILAGGQARRMNQQDKGLVLYDGAPLVSYAIAAMLPVVSELWINANRNQAEYARFGFRVISDQTTSFDGPLAGILAALSETDAPILLVMPCDSPLITAKHLQKLVAALLKSDAEIAVATEREKMQPVFLALKTHLKADLADFLGKGERKIGHWIARQAVVKVDFASEAEIFLNLNTLEELNALEQHNFLF